MKMIPIPTSLWSMHHLPNAEAATALTRVLGRMKDAMPFLVLISTLSGSTVCPSKEGASCVGCRECARLFCTECQLKGKDNTYTRGCKNFHMGGCRTHMSIHHPPRQQGKSPIAEGLAKAVQAHAEKIQGIMYNVYRCAKRNIALHNIGYISDLCELHGVCLGKHYNHEVAAREFLICIADAIRAEIIEAARSSPCLGLMVDESTDVSKTGASVMYLRLLFRGAFRTLFWRIVQVVDGSAEGLFDLIATQFETDGIPKSLLFSFASDGASVMAGDKTGVAVRLVAAFNLFMLTCHCIAHRHALACASAADGNAICIYFEAILAEVIGYHSHSAKRHEHLEKLQALLGVHKLRMVRLVATRWLSRGAAVHRVYEIISALLMEFQEDQRDKSNALAGPLVDQTQCAKFIICLAIFNDILYSMCQLSMAFQKDHV